MTTFFNSLLSVTAGASILIVLVVALSALLGKRYSRKWRYWAWLFIAIRLVLPFDIPLDTSIFTFSVPEESTYVSYVPEQNKAGAITNPDKIVIDPDKTENVTQTPTNPTPVIPPTTITPSKNDHIVIPNIPIEDVVDVTPVKTIPYTTIFMVVWIVGIAVSTIIYAVSHVRFLGRVKLWNRTVTEPWANEIFKNVKLEMGISEDIQLYRNRSVHSPILAGFFKPMILIPTRNLTETDLYMVLRHELLHYKRRDLWYKLVLVLTGCLHWFNPLVWFMVKRADRDLEIACDEAVVKGTSMEFRRDYCDTILRIIRCDRGRKPALSTGFTTDKKTMKKRFACALDFTKKRTGVVLLSLVLCAAILCSTFIACDITKNLTPQEIFDSITQEDIDDAIENPDEFTEEELQYYKSILDPYEYSIGVSGEVSWSDTLDIVSKLIKYYEISPNGFAEFFNKVQNKEAKAVKISENLMFVPADVVEDYIAERFNIDKEAFRNKAWYLDEYNEYVELSYAFNTDMGYGGFYDYSILKVEKSGNIWKFYCSNSYPVYYGNEEIYEEDYAVIVVEHNGENDYKFLCAKGFHEDKFASVRAKFVYPFSNGVPEFKEGYVGFDESISQENRNKEFASLLYYSARAGKNGYNDTYFLGDQDMASAAISMLRDTVYSSEYGDFWGDSEDKLVILNHINEGEFIPQEWVEKAVKQIWGEDVSINHQDSFDWVYNKDVGVYVPRGMMSNYIHPYIHSVTKTEKGYVAELSYIYSNGDIWGDAGGYENAIGSDNHDNIFADADVVTLAKRQTIYSVRAEYGDNGKLYLVSCVKKGISEHTRENIRQILMSVQDAYQNDGSCLEFAKKNPDVVISNVDISEAYTYMGFENQFAIPLEEYELLNISKMNSFVEKYENLIEGQILAIKSGSPLPLYAVLLKFDGKDITRQMFYLNADTLVEGKVEVVKSVETSTMWIFKNEDKVLDVFPKRDFTPLSLVDFLFFSASEKANMSVNEIVRALGNNTLYTVKYDGDETIDGIECYSFGYYNTENEIVNSLFISKDLQRMFIAEEENGSKLLLTK